MIKYYLTIITSLMLVNTFSLEAKECMSGNCENGKGFAKYGDEQYIGDFKDSKPSGNGNYIWKDGTAYLGQFKNGVPEGKGEYIWPDGRKYVGEFKNGQPNGKGKMTFKDGEEFEGTFRDGILVDAKDRSLVDKFAKKTEGSSSKVPSLSDLFGGGGEPEKDHCVSGNCVDGTGTAEYDDGKFTGSFLKKFFNGAGTYTWPDGSTYTGGFKDGRPHGQGSYTKPDGTNYTGEFKFGQPNGNGKLTDKDKKVYEGRFVKGALVKPKKKISDKKKLQDYLAKGKPEVASVDKKAIDPASLSAEKDYYASDLPFWKKKFSLGAIGDWFKGSGDSDSGKKTAAKKVNCVSGNCVNGKGTAKYKNNEEYTGDFKDGFFNGMGTYTWPDGTTYTGQFKDGRPHGKGSYTKPDGTNYTGEFEFGKPDGEGKLTDKNGKAYEGTFSKGKLVKPKKNIADKKARDQYLSFGKPNVNSVDKDAVSPKSVADERSSGSSGISFGSGFGGSSFLKSAIIPGWTQWDNGEKVKGSIFFGSFLLTAGILYKWDRTYKSQKNDYNRSADYLLAYPNNLGLIGLGYMGVKDQQDTYKKTGNQATKLSIGLVTIYLVNVIDAIFFSKPVNSAALYKTEGLQFSTDQYRFNSQFLDNTYNIQYIWRF